MKMNLLDQIGDWNPQLFRELKGRLKLRNVAIVVAVLIAAQVLLLLFCQGWLPSTEAVTEQLQNNYDYKNQFCTGSLDNDYETYSYKWYTCLLDPNTKQVLINWQVWWREIFKICTWMLPYILLLPGTYLLVTDFSQEEKRGTLNFIRLSPQSAQSILTGKLLGVPVLAYLATALAIPLHLWAAVRANAPAELVLSFYLLLGLAGYFLYRTSLLFASLEKGAIGNSGQNIVSTFSLGMVLLTLFFIPVFMIWNINTTWYAFRDYVNFGHHNSVDWHWFFLPLTRNLWQSFGFTAVNLGLGSFWVGQALNRRFHNPNLTILSKKQSYGLIACLEVLVVGFCQPLLSDKYQLQSILILLYMFNLAMFLSLMAALSPHRQALIDWARYSESSRRESTRDRNSRSLFPHSLVIKDLLFGEKSPAPMAIALNLIIVGAIVTPLVLSLPNHSHWQKTALATAIFAVIMMIYAVVIQTMLFMKTKRREFWTVGTVVAIVVLPPIVFSALSFTPDKSPLLWLFSAFPIAGVSYASSTTIAFALLGQIAVLATLNWNLNRKLQKAGESELKMLMSDHH